MDWDDIKLTDAPTGSVTSSGESSVYQGSSPNKAGEDDWVEDAYLAHGAYHGGDVEGYTIDRDLSDEWSTTYINNATKKATVAFAGTNLNGPGGLSSKVARGASDINADFAIAGGQEESNWQYKAVDDKMKRAIAKYGQQNVHTTGHSLGGNKAIYASSKYGVTSTSFNPGFSPFDVLNHTTNLTGHKWDFSRSHAYVVPGDPVAVSAYAQPGLKITSLNKPDKLRKIKNDFQGKAYEEAARVGMADILAAVHPAAAAAYTAAGVYTVGKDVYALHASDNFLNPRHNIPMPSITTPVKPPPQTATPVVHASNRRRRHTG